MINKIRDIFIIVELLAICKRLSVKKKPEEYSSK
jgi:hypothetical protein